MGNSKIYNYPPNKEELISLIMNDEDPRSNNYRRLLIRPKIKWGVIVSGFGLWIIILFLIVIVFKKQAISTKWTIGVIIIISAFLLLFFAKRLIITGIQIYQRYSPDSIRNKCRFEPSCSEYMILAIKKYGLIRGIIKGVGRLKRCNINSGGFDMP